MLFINIGHVQLAELNRCVSSAQPTTCKHTVWCFRVCSAELSMFCLHTHTHTDSLFAWWCHLLTDERDSAIQRQECCRCVIKGGGRRAKLKPAAWELGDSDAEINIKLYEILVFLCFFSGPELFAHPLFHRIHCFISAFPAVVSLFCFLMLLPFVDYMQHVHIKSDYSLNM